MDLLLLDGLRPFVVLAGFILVLTIFEILLMLIGLSSSVEFDGMGGLDADGFAADHVVAMNLNADELALLDLPLTDELQRDIPPKPSLVHRMMVMIGLGQGPILVWTTCLAAGISICGFFVQLVLHQTMGAMLPSTLAMGLVVLPGILLGRQFSAWAAYMVPNFETHAISAQTYHGRRGTVVIGTAIRGAPAQVRWQDLYGTVHSLMAEPLRDQDSLTAGTQVLIVKTRDRQPRLVPIA